MAEEVIAEANFKIEQAKKRYEANSSFLTSKLAEYFEKVPKKATKTQETYRLLSGTLVRRFATVKPTPDKEKLAQWLKTNGYTDYIKTIEEPKWGEFKELLNTEGNIPTIKDTGEIVEGVALVEPIEFKSALSRWWQHEYIKCLRFAQDLIELSIARDNSTQK